MLCSALFITRTAPEPAGNARERVDCRESFLPKRQNAHNTPFKFDMKSGHPESDSILSINRLGPLLSRQLPRVVTNRESKKTEDHRDGVAKATVTHSESGVKEKKTERKLLRELSKLEPKTRKKRGKGRRGWGPTVDTSRSKASCEVVRLAIRELGWREFPVGRRTGCDYYWLGGLFEMPELPETGQMSKFVGMSEASHKVELTKHLNRLHFLFPHEFSFYPKTWTLPEQYGELLGYVTKAKIMPTLILKPDGGSQGEGIFLMQNIYDVHHSTALIRPSVVQEYVAEPYLLEKFKFDLRIYVVLKSLDPLQIYICREGMARFCTEHYQRPTPKNIHRVYMHLTNYSLNKNSPGYVQSEAGDKGSKRKLSAVFKQLEKQGCDIVKLWAEIDKVSCQTIIALVPILKLYSHITTAELKHELKSFQILGFDILLDKDLNPILLEVNSSPSLRIDYEEEISPRKVEYFLSTTDMDIKLPIVRDSLSLSWQHRKTKDENLPDRFGCLEQIYPKLASALDHLRVMERCLALFRHFIGVRATDKMGPTSFRMMARRCHLTDFGFTLAAFEILFINMTRRYSNSDSGRASLDFNGFCESLIAIGHKKLALIMRHEPVEILLTVLKHCEDQLSKPLDGLSNQQTVGYSTGRSSNRKLKSCFHLPTSPMIK